MLGRVMLTSALTIAVTGCQLILGIDDPQRGNPDLPDAGDGPDASDEPGVTATLLTPSPSVPLGGENFFVIEIERTGGLTGDVDVTITGAPSGITATALTIVEGDTTGELLLSAAAPLAIGDTASFDIVAELGANSDTIAVTDAPITGAPATADVDFANNGVFGIIFSNDDGARFKDCVVGADSKITAIGFGDGGLGGNSHNAIRLLADGTIDSTWNGGALRRDVFVTGTTSESAKAVAGGHQGDGRFIAIGDHNSNGFTKDLALMRYGTDGVVGPDINFGNQGDGKTLHDLGGAETINDGLVLSNSRIVAVGFSDGNAVIAQTEATSGLDSTFATTGFRIETSAGFSSSVFHAVAVDSSDRIVAVGSATAGALPGIFIARYNSDGTPDTTFDSDGFLTESEDTESATARAVVIRPDNRILVASKTAVNGGSTFDLELKQYHEDGSPDTAFGTDGVVITDVGGVETPVGMVLQPDGRAIVLVDVTGTDQQLVRFRTDGNLDTTFDNDGKAVVFIGDDPTAENMTLSAQNNRIIVCGGNAGGFPGMGANGIVTQVWF